MSGTLPTMTRQVVVLRLSAESVDALRFAGQRQLTRWGRRELSPRDAERREALSDALAALAPLKHSACELRRLAPKDQACAESSRRGGPGAGT